MGVGDNLKAILKQKHMTIKSLSDKSGIPVNTLYSITKRNAGIDKKTALKISDTLNIPLDSILVIDNMENKFDTLFRQAAEGTFDNDVIEKIITYSNQFAKDHLKESNPPIDDKEIMNLFMKMEPDAQRVMIRLLKLINNDSHNNSSEGDE